MMTPLPMLATSPGLDLRALPAVRIEALYVHVPFCFHKCHYCDFYSITRQSPERMSAFVDRVLAEAQMWTGQFRGDIRPNTVFFGGGTPSLLPLDLMARLLGRLRTSLDLSEVNEWTVEANPATVTEDYLVMLRENGVDRLSFGAQSFDRRHLATLERHHDPEDVPRSVELARRAGFNRLNIDLIYAIPGQSLDAWTQSLDQAIALRTEHVSAYGLTYEPNTPIAVKKRLGQLVPASDEVEIQMLRAARAQLSAAGLLPYEISNYARPEEACRHNLAYWSGENYLALGPSGSSHVEGARWRNRPHLGEWEQSIDSHQLPATDVETLEHRQRAGELAMLMLRLSDGIDIRKFSQKIEQDPTHLFRGPLAPLVNQRLLEISSTHIRLTEAGLAVADAIAAELL